MKPKIALLALLASALAVGPIQAQTSPTNAPPAAAVTATSVAGFASSVEGFFTSFSSNTWTGTHGYAETGAAYKNNVDFASSLTLGVDALSIGTNGLGLVVSSDTYNAGVAGVIDAEVFKVGLKYDIKDVRLSVGLGGGYDFVESKIFPDIGLEAQKKLTANTHAFVALDEMIESKQQIPVIKIGVGFTF